MTNLGWDSRDKASKDAAFEEVSVFITKLYDGLLLVADYKRRYEALEKKSIELNAECATLTNIVAGFRKELGARE